MKILKEIIPYIVIIVVVVLIRTFIITPVRVDGPSMEKTLYNGDILLLEKYNHNFKRFNIVVIKYNGDSIVKRIIGLPGDTVVYKNNVLYINGKEVDEPFLEEDTEDFSLENLGYEKVPDGYYFVVGDNRDASLDSRYIGLISKGDIKGKVIFRIFPFNAFGKF